MKKIALVIACASFVAGCSKQESSEPKVETSVSVDLDKEKAAVGNAMEKAGEDLKRGANEAKAKLEDAGDALKKNVEAAKDKLTDDKKASIEVEVKKD